MSYQDMEWRGGPGVFPTGQGVSYREFRAGISGGVWGEGLLDYKRYGDPCVKAVVLPADLQPYARAELLVFGTGRYRESVVVNGRSLPLPSVGQLSLEHEPYECLGDSVHRSYHLAEVPIECLRAGVNEVWLEPTHAFVQRLAIRLFYDRAVTKDAVLTGERVNGRHILKLEGNGLDGVERVDFFASYPGMDIDGSGRHRTWHAGLNRRLESELGYEIVGHCGSIRSAPWQVVWKPSLVPAGEIGIRGRIHRQDGTVVESPGGIIDVLHRPAEQVSVVRPREFAPFGFNENGWQQEHGIVCVYEVGSIGGLSGAVLGVPLYGRVRMVLNGERVLEATAPLGGYHMRQLEVRPEWLVEGDNELELRPVSGATGCYQAPGPVLHLIGAASSADAEAVET